MLGANVCTEGLQRVRFFLGYSKRKKKFWEPFWCICGVKDCMLFRHLWSVFESSLASLEQSWFCASLVLVVPPEVKPADLAALVEKTLRHGQRASSWKPRLKEKKKVMPFFCWLSNIQAEGKKCSAEKSHPRTPPPRGVFPWPLWQHITLPYRRLPTPQLFRETNKRAFKLFASLFFRAWKVICLLCQMSPLMFAPIMYGAWIEILEPSSVAYLDFVLF